MGALRAHYYTSEGSFWMWLTASPTLPNEKVFDSSTGSLMSDEFRTLNLWLDISLSTTWDCSNLNKTLTYDWEEVSITGQYCKNINTSYSTNFVLDLLYRAITEADWGNSKKNRLTRRTKPNKECLIFLEFMTMKRLPNVNLSKNGWNMWSMNKKSIITNYIDFMCQEEITRNNPPTKWTRHYFLVGVYSHRSDIILITPKCQPSDVAYFIPYPISNMICGYGHIGMWLRIWDTIPFLLKLSQIQVNHY